MHLQHLLVWVWTLWFILTCAGFFLFVLFFTKMLQEIKTVIIGPVMNSSDVAEFGELNSEH